MEQRDLLRVIRLSLGSLPASLVPSPVARRSIDLLLSLLFRLRPEKPAKLAARMEKILGPPAEGVDLFREARDLYGHDFEEGLGRMQNLLWNAWKPEIEVDGLERVRESQERGRGTLIWRMSFGSSMILKAGLSRAGVGLVHLSRPYHGCWTEAWISRHVLAPLYRRTEGWYLKERVLISPDGGTTGVMRTLLARLKKENAVVSIVGDHLGTQNITTPFLHGRAQFAIGAPALAWKAGSTLLPAFAFRTGTLRYRVVIDEPISADRALDRKEFVESAVKEFSHRMQRAIASHPGSWANWNHYLQRTSIFRNPPVATA